MPTREELTKWSANNWHDLVGIWRGLVGDVYAEAEPTFREENMTAVEAGYVFQTWIVEAFRISGAEIEPPSAFP